MVGFYRGHLACFILPHASFFLLSPTAPLPRGLLPVSNTVSEPLLQCTVLKTSPPRVEIWLHFQLSVPQESWSVAEYLSLCFCSLSKEQCFYLSMSWVTQFICTIPLQPLSPKQSLISLNPDSGTRLFFQQGNQTECRAWQLCTIQAACST